jgi:hypothetical protein
VILQLVAAPSAPFWQLISVARAQPSSRPLPLQPSQVT